MKRLVLLLSLELLGAACARFSPLGMPGPSSMGATPNADDSTSPAASGADNDPVTNVDTSSGQASSGTAASGATPDGNVAAGTLGSSSGASTVVATGSATLAGPMPVVTPTLSSGNGEGISGTLSGSFDYSLLEAGDPYIIAETNDWYDAPGTTVRILVASKPYGDGSVFLVGVYMGLTPYNVTAVAAVGEVTQAELENPEFKPLAPTDVNLSKDWNALSVRFIYGGGFRTITLPITYASPALSRRKPVAVAPITRQRQN